MKTLKSVAKYSKLVAQLPLILLLVLAYPFFLTTVLIQDYLLSKS